MLSHHWVMSRGIGLFEWDQCPDLGENWDQTWDTDAYTKWVEIPAKEAQDEAPAAQPEPEKEQTALGCDEYQFRGLELLKGMLMPFAPREMPRKKKMIRFRKPAGQGF